MYKWGFFILLGVNAALMAVSFSNSEVERVKQVQERPIKEIVIKDDQKEQTTKIENKTPLKTRTLEFDLREKRRESVKNALLENQRNRLSNEYGYFFAHHNLSHDEFEVVVEILQSKDLESYSCCGDQIDNREGLAKTISQNLSLEVSNKVIDMLNREWVYRSVLGIFDYETENINDVRGLVEELYAYEEKQKALKGYDVDPFGKPFDTVDELDLIGDNDADVLVDEIFDNAPGANFDDEELSEEMQKLRRQEEVRKYIDEMYEALNEKQIDYLQGYLENVSLHAEISDEMLLRVMNELFN
ncbi:MAG: hypothetical protein NE327_13800 [Lentisphaeraceae bacterium]|nr:hypothetical protein [Lentisphaeraceae bacterium]